MKVGDTVKNIRSGRVTKIKKIEFKDFMGEKTNMYTIFNERFDRDDSWPEKDFLKNWEPFTPD